ncbi:MAG: hypothetical protein DRN30_01865 [Thermoplasmata archaeon]|nr:MAG: hypothetical protein DRN30_01865 [Thermoplasmata archaeon]
MTFHIEKEDVTLQKFSDKQQDAIVGWITKDRKFFLACMTHLKGGFFASAISGAVFDAAQQWHTEYKAVPTLAELQGALNSTFHMSPLKYQNHLNMCVAATKDITLGPLSSLMSGWMKTIKLSNSIEEAGRLFNASQFNKAKDIIEKKMTEIRNTSFESDERVVFGDAIDFFTNRSESFEDCLTIGHPVFDEMLRDGAKIANPDMSKSNPKEWTHGGLVKGDTTIILGPSNSGKTTVVTSIIVPNIINEKYILYITHEQKWEDIKTKIFMNMCEATGDELSNPDEILKRKMKINGEKLDKYLIYIPWVKAGEMWVESVINEIILQQEILISRIGKGFDMLVNDYPGKLKSKEMKGRAGWEEADYVYDQFVNLGMEHRFHNILPVQTNRDGYKVNRGDHSGSRVIDQADAAGSFGIMQKADNVITLNRSPDEQASNVMRFYISKSRTNEAQTTFATKTDFAKSKTHGVQLQSLKFKASDQSTPQAVMQVLAMDEVGGVDEFKRKIAKEVMGDSVKKTENVRSSDQFPATAEPGANIGVTVLSDEEIVEAEEGIEPIK